LISLYAKDAIHRLQGKDIFCGLVAVKQSLIDVIAALPHSGCHVLNIYDEENGSAVCEWHSVLEGTVDIRGYGILELENSKIIYQFSFWTL